MPISQNEMTPLENQAVMAALAERLTRIGQPRYDSNGDDWGLTPPIEPGELRHSRGGAPWAVFGSLCYRLMDTDECRCVLDSDGRPLGVYDEGLLVLVEVRGNPVAVVVNTGQNDTTGVRW